MAGTIIGGKKAAQTNKKKEPGFYARIGSKGGKKTGIKGFAVEQKGKDGLTGRERARLAGAKGGAKSRRGPSKPKPQDKEHISVFDWFRRKK